VRSVPDRDEVTLSASPSLPLPTPGAEVRLRGRRRPGGGQTVLVNGLRLLVLVVVLLSWEVAARNNWVDPYFVSSPSGVFDFAVEYVGDGLLWEHLSVTLQETFLGFIIGSSGGIAVGLLLARFTLLDRVLDPFLTVLNSLPRVALAPLFLLWFGLGMTSKVVLAVSLVFFILVINTRLGVRNVDPDLVTVGLLLGSKEHQLFRSVILPAALPAIFAGLRLGVIYSLLGAVVGEMIAAEAGIGQQLTYFSGTFQTDGVVAMLVLLALIAALLDGLTVLAERRVLGWQRRGRL
jgi:NitT/TauT family transport system permease protein